MGRPEITVIDFGVGNLLSVQRALEHCGASVVTSSDPERVHAASKLVLPGVGAFANAMEALERLGLVEPIRTAAVTGVPLLGICLGMQLLLDESEEFGLTPGLGLIPGRVVAIPNRTTDLEGQKIPHIGWNRLVPAGGADWSGTILADVRPQSAVYFVHSFMAEPSDPAHRLADCLYGGHRVAATLAAGNISACQFHPEKSGEFGLAILRRFIDA